MNLHRLTALLTCLSNLIHAAHLFRATPSPQPPHGVSPIQPKCNCLWEGIWNDVIYLFDRSAYTTNFGLQELLYHVQTDIDFYTLSRANGSDASKQNMRTGIILYDDNATLLYPLGTLNNDDFNAINSLPFSNRQGTNIEQAIKLAMSEFDGSNHRAYSRKVIVILAAALSKDSPDPSQIVETFKEDGGIIVVYNLLADNESPNKKLENIASYGYFSTSQEDVNGTFLRDAQCDANCFCFNNYKSYLGNPRNVPLFGCYRAVEATSNFQKADNNCERFYNGTQAIIESKDKFQFTYSCFLNPVNFWIGLKYDTTKKVFEWPDGSPLGDYQPWATTQPQTTETKLCVFAPQTNSPEELSWVVDDCRNSRCSVCEASPCDSTLFCPY